MKFLSPLLFGSLFLLSCSKEKNDNWLIANIKTVDADTDAEIPAEVKITYLNAKKEDEGTQVLDLGICPGSMYLEEKVKGKPAYVQIKARAFDYYRPPYYNELDFRIQDFDPEVVNAITFEFPPVYLYKFHFKSIGCVNEFDSLTYRVVYRPNVEEYVQTDPVTIYGCADTILPGGPTYSDALFSFENEVTLKYDLYRAGFHTNDAIVYDLEKATENLILVEY